MHHERIVMKNLKFFFTEGYNKSYLSISDSNKAFLEQADIEEIITFLEDNNWFNVQPHFADTPPELYVTEQEAQKLEFHLSLFFENKDKPTSEKINILLLELKRKLPQTSKFLLEFSVEYNIPEDDLYCLIDFILWSTQKEIFLYGNQEISAWIDLMCKELNLKLGNMLCDFLFFIKQNHKTRYSRSFNLLKRSSKLKQAYDSDKYLQLIYYLFNEDYIIANSMYEKAAQNKNTADAWLYLSLHLICALRDTDLLRIPHPRLNRAPQDILKDVSNGCPDWKEALLAINGVLWTLRNIPITPSKTAQYTGISHLKLTIPESTMKHFGLIFLIAESHFQLTNVDEDSFIRKIADYNSICRYMGEEIGELFLEEDFSVRSANKTYMQAIELFSDTILDAESKLPHAKGYMLAAMARSHKGSYGEFAKTTEIYLKDANFSGYTAEFVAKELFERGVCSFIPSMLLKMITSGDYNKLPISDQTKLVQELGLSPNEIENIIGITDFSLQKAGDIVKKIVSSTDNKHDTILSILHNIACGNAASKIDESLCLITAMNRKCPTPERRQCIGCNYEIHTKSTIYLLASEFRRIYSLRENAPNIHLQNKYTALLRETVVPAMNEIFSCISDIYGDEALTELEEIIKENAYE